MSRWRDAVALTLMMGCEGADPGEVDDPNAPSPPTTTDTATGPAPVDPGLGSGEGDEIDDNTAAIVDDTQAPVGHTWTDPTTRLIWQDPAPVKTVGC